MSGNGIGAQSVAEGDDRDRKLGRLPFFLLLLVWIASLVLALVTTYLGAREHLAIYGLNWPLPAAQQKWILLFWWLVPTTLFIVTSALLMVARSRNAVATLLSLSLVVFSTTNIVSGNAWVRDWFWLSVSLDALAWLGFMTVFLIFPTGNFALRWTRWAVIAAAAFQFSAAGVVIASFNGIRVGIDPNLLQSYLQPLAQMSFFMLGMLALWQRWRRAEGLERGQIGWVLLSLVPGTFFITAWAVLNMGGYGPAGGVVLPLGLACLAIGFLVALLRYHLYGFRIAVSRSIAYAIIIAVFGALFLIGEEILKQTVGQRIEHEATAKLIVAVLALLLTSPLKTGVTRWVDQWLMKPIVELRERLPQWIAEVRDSSPLPELLVGAAQRIDGALRPVRLAILVDGKPLVQRGAIDDASLGAWLKAAPITASGSLLQPEAASLFPIRIPLRVTPQAQGDCADWLLLGPKAAEGIYGRDELKAVASVAAPLAGALRQWRRREQEEAWMEAVLAALRERRPSGTVQRGATGEGA